ncbi:hypothetical protein Areg01_75940 [Actinoplanes regularis]|nr:hypothetical protein Areg01_75940 [Actinoplanes regularis]
MTGPDALPVHLRWAGRGQRRTGRQREQREKGEQARRPGKESAATGMDRHDAPDRVTEMSHNAASLAPGASPCQ